MTRIPKDLTIIYLDQIIVYIFYMKIVPVTIIFLFALLTSCGNSAGEKVSIEKHLPETEAVSSQDHIAVCEKFWEKRHPASGTKKLFLENILTENNLTADNKKFVSALINNPTDSVLVTQKPIFPIFRLSEKEAGIFAFPFYSKIEEYYVDTSAERKFIDNFSDFTTPNIPDTAVNYFPDLMEHLLQIIESPDFYYYSLTGKGEAQIENFGALFGECSEYYTYLLAKNEKIDVANMLFGSPYRIDLEYENFPEIDSLLSARNNPGCLDCPTSFHLEKTFARLKGATNVYFVYADSFSLSEHIDTPSRSIIVVDEVDEVWNLWYEEVDQFGCSCL